MDWQIALGCFIIGFIWLMLPSKGERDTPEDEIEERRRRH